MGGRTHPIHHDGYILELFGPSIESSQVVIHRLRALLRGTDELCSDLGDSYQSLVDTLLGSAFGGSPVLYPRLATGAGESGDAIGRLEGTFSLAGGGGGRLVLLKAVLSAIPTYFMAIFRMLAGVHCRLESVMRGFFWRGSRQEESRGVALVAWETMCQPVSQGRLGVLHFQHANMALLTKWVARLMHPSGDLIAAILRDGYDASLDWQMWQTPQRGDSAFMSSLRPIFKAVQPFFRPKLGTGESFRFWADEWSGNGRLSQSFQPDVTRGAALVAWKTMCRPMSQGGLGIQNLLHTNMALLSKWVGRMMQPSDDLVFVVL